jgi:hypothetical protein
MIQVWFNDPVAANGYYVRTSLDSPSRDMSQWVIEYTASNWTLNKRLILSESYSLRLPMKRGTEFIMDFTTEVPFHMMSLATPFIFASGFALSVIMGAVGWETSVPGVLVATFLCSAFVRAVSGLGFFISTGNYIGYATIWITTPQVSLAIALLI